MAVLATSTSMTGKKTEEELEQVPCIWFSVNFEDQTETLLNSESKVNAINLVFTSQPGFRIWKTNIAAQKIDGTTLKTYGMVVSIFSLLNKNDREKFFEESFLWADIKLDTMLEIPFLTMRNVDIDLQAWNLQ